jgi:hypothetical protein
MRRRLLEDLAAAADILDRLLALRVSLKLVQTLFENAEALEQALHIGCISHSHCIYHHCESDKGDNRRQYRKASPHETRSLPTKGCCRGTLDQVS